MPPLISVLFDGSGEPAPLHAAEREALHDLHLDQLTALVGAHSGAPLAHLLTHPAGTADAIRFRQEVIADLEQPAISDAVVRFGAEMDGIHVLRHPPGRRARSVRPDAVALEAADRYCVAVRALADGLRDELVTSRGLTAVREHLDAYLTSAAFGELSAGVGRLTGELARLRYRLELEPRRVTVTSPDGAADFGAELERALARFEPRERATPRRRSYEMDEMSDLEEQVLEGVRALHPDFFARRSQFAARHREFLDPTLLRFDHEVRCYLAYLELIEPIKRAGLPFCLPEIAAAPGAVHATGAFDIALAGRRAQSGRAVVTNDFELAGAERILVVTGPNNGGKTTLARTFGQLHHLARCGLPVPGRSARLTIADRVLTHFEREESLATQQGKFEEELVRAHQILSLATARSVIVMNESFNSTSLTDATFVGTEIVGQITTLGAFAVYVTFIDELASLSPATVSMVAQVMPEDPTRRTLQVIRQPPSGLAYAWALADRYGLGYAQVMERLGG